MTSNDGFTPLAEIGSATEAGAVADLVTRIAAFAPADEYDEHLPADLLVAVGANREGPRIATADLEQFRFQPRRKKGHTVLHRLDSFLLFLERHWEDPDRDTDRDIVRPASALYVDATEHSVVAVLDDHNTAGAGWREFSAAYVPRMTPEYNAWLTLSGGWIDQSHFAEFLSEWRHTIVEPDAADVYEMAQRFEATVNAEFSQGARMATGARQLVYREDVAAKSGELEIPDSLTLSFPLYDDPVCSHEPVAVSLRFRLRDGELRFRVDLEHVEALESRFFDSVVAQLERHDYATFYGTTS